MTIDEHRRLLDVKRRKAIQFLCAHWRWGTQWSKAVELGTLNRGYS